MSGLDILAPTVTVVRETLNASTDEVVLELAAAAQAVEIAPPPIVEVTASGPQGAQGPTGPPGSALVFAQVGAASVWTILHALGFYPNVTIETADGRVVDASLAYPDADTVIATFSEPVEGRAFLS